MSSIWRARIRRACPEGWQLQPSHPELLDAWRRISAPAATACGSLFRDDLPLECVSAFGALRRRVEGILHQVLRAQVRAHVERGRSARRHRGRHQPARAASLSASEKVGMAMQLSGPAGGGDIKYFMQTFGQSNRNNPPKPLTGSPLQPLLLMQSPVVNDRVLGRRRTAASRRLLDTYKDDNGRVVEEMFLATLIAASFGCREKGCGGSAREEPGGRRPEPAMGPGQPGRVFLQLLGGSHENSGNSPERRDLLQIRRPWTGGRFGRRGSGQLKAAPTDRKVHPRGNARNVLFYEISGAISHVESFDFKENAGHAEGSGRPQDRSRSLPVAPAVSRSFEKQMDKIAILRSLLSHEEVHFRGAILHPDGPAAEPCVRPRDPVDRFGHRHGAGIAPPAQTTPSPSTCRSTWTRPFPGALSTGFLPPRFSVVDINPDAAVKGMALDQKAIELLEERWRLLTRTARSGAVSGYRPIRARNGQLRGFLRHGPPAADRRSLAHRVPDRRRGPQALRQHCRSASPASLRAMSWRRTRARTTSTSAIPAGTTTCRSGIARRIPITIRSVPGVRSCLLQPAGRSGCHAVRRQIRRRLCWTRRWWWLMGEFGRTPGALNNMAGRDHYNKCYPALFAGAGVKGGRVLGRTDAAGREVRRDRLAAQGAAANGEHGWRRCTPRWVSTGPRRSATRRPGALTLRGSAGRQRLHPHG